MVFTLEQFKNWVNVTFPDNNVRAISEADLREGLTNLADLVFDTTEEASEKVDSVYQQFALADGLGTLNAATGVATNREAGTTYSPVRLADKPKGKFYDIVEEGNSSIIDGTPVLFKVGGRVISRGTKWDYIPPIDTGYEQLIALESMIRSLPRIPVKQRPNIFNKNTIIDNFSIQAATGALVPTPGWKTSDFIAVKASTLYRLWNGSIPSNGNLPFAIYDNNKIFISSGTASSVSVPASGAFVRVSATNVNDLMMIADGLTPTEYLSSGYNVETSDPAYPVFLLPENIAFAVRGSYESIVAAMMGRQFSLIKTEQRANLYNHAVSLANSIIGANGSTSVNNGYTTSDFIAVTPGSTVYAFVYNPATDIVSPLTVQAAFYNKDKFHVTPKPGSANNFTVPGSGVEFIRICGNNDWQYVMLQTSAVAPARHVPFGWELKTNDANYPLTITASNIAAAIQGSSQAIKDTILLTSKSVTPIQAAFTKRAKNIFNPNAADVLLGRVLNTSFGSTSANATYNTSGFIPVSEGQTLFASAGTPGRSATTIAVVFNENKIFIGALTFTNSKATVPAGAAFARVSSPTATWSQYMVLTDQAFHPDKFIPFGWNLASSDLEFPVRVTSEGIKDALLETVGSIPPAAVNFVTQSHNLINKLDPRYRINGSINKNTGAESAATGFNATGFIEVTPLLPYFCTHGSVTPGGVSPSESAWYDVDRNYISAVSFNSGLTYAPANARYIRISMQAASMEFMQFVQTDVLPKYYAPYEFAFNDVIRVRDAELRAIYRPWNGKGWLALGDSITFGGSYMRRVSEITGLVLKGNQGVVGQVLRTMADQVTIESLADVDIVTILGGTNDYGHGTATVGDITDAKEANTICGSVKLLVDKILSLKPDVRIVFFTPTTRGAYAVEPNWTPPQPNNKGLTMDNISKAIIDTARSIHIAAFDLNAITGINRYNLTTYTSDGLHPNSAGGTRIGGAIGNCLNRLG